MVTALDRLSEIIFAEANATTEAERIICRMLKVQAENTARRQTDLTDRRQPKEE